jgi:hypothetical protein
MSLRQELTQLTNKLIGLKSWYHSWNASQTIRIDLYVNDDRE